MQRESEASLSGPSTAEQLRQHLSTLRRRWRVVVLLPAIALVVGVIVTLQGSKQYEATAKLVLNSNDQVAALLNPGVDQSSADPERDLNTAVSQITVLPIADQVRRQLRLPVTNEQLLKKVSAGLEGTTNLVDVKAKDPDPARAAAIANAFAAQYVAFRASDARNSFTQAVTLARGQLSALIAAGAGKGQLATQLRARIQQLQVASTLQTSNAEITENAAVPTSASRHLARNAFLAVVLGLILGLVAAILIELTDRRLRDEEEVRALTGVSVLGRVPRRRRGLVSRISARVSAFVANPPAEAPRAGQPTLVDQDMVESYRALAIKVRYLMRTHKLKTLMVSSPEALDGKTTVSLGLAAALAQLGETVIAVECDLRRPSFGDYLGLEASPGLAAVLGGASAPVDALVPIDARAQRALHVDRPGRRRFYHVLPSGPPSADPQSDLSSDEMAAAIKKLASTADLVLIDTPPVGLLSDALPLTEIANGVAMVVRVGHTRRDALERAQASLDEVDADLVGVVITGSALEKLGRYYGGEEGAVAELAAGELGTADVNGDAVDLRPKPRSARTRAAAKPRTTKAKPAATREPRATKARTAAPAQPNATRSKSATNGAGAATPEPEPTPVRDEPVLAAAPQPDAGLDVARETEPAATPVRDEPVLAAEPQPDAGLDAREAEPAQDAPPSPAVGEPEPEAAPEQPEAEVAEQPEPDVAADADAEPAAQAVPRSG